MKRSKMVWAAILSLALLTGCTKAEKSKKQESDAGLDPERPAVVTVWNYYTGNQQESFDNLVDEFNQTVGKEKGVVVKAVSQGSVVDVEDKVLAAINKDVGAEEAPDIFAAYAETAYKLDKLQKLADISSYMTKDEISMYLESYIEEGRLPGGKGLKIFPVAKSTEIFMLNKSDWDKFSAATGTVIKELDTIEGVTEVAQKYYEWTDSLTASPDDGKAFFGRDAMGNYMVIGAKQLGVDILQADSSGKVKLDFDRDVVKKLWDNYYIPFIKGYFAAEGRFRSDDIKTGSIISFVGSSSGATFFPDKVILSDEDSYPIETLSLTAPQFKKSEGFAIQQGAGMAVMKGKPEQELASVEFLKWFTDAGQNIKFSLDSGYLPVKKDANEKESIKSEVKGGQNVRNIMEVSLETVHDNTLYNTPAGDGVGDARSILNDAMSEYAVKDRESIEGKLSQGESLDEAAAEFVTDAHFEQWYLQVSQELQNVLEH